MTKLTEQQAKAEGYPHFNRDTPCKVCGDDWFYVSKPMVCVACEKKRTAEYRELLAMKDKRFSGAERLEIIEKGGGTEALEFVLKKPGSTRGLFGAWLVHKDSGKDYQCIGAFQPSNASRPEDFLDWKEQLKSDWGFEAGI